MYQEILQDLGLSPNEAKIYETLLEINEAGVGEISKVSKIHRRNVYDALHRLVDKGLIYPILSKRENRYSPVDPGKFSEILQEREQKLQSILPNLQKLYQEKNRDQEAYIYRGVEGLKNYLRDMVRTGEDVYTIGGKLGWLDPQIQGFASRIINDASQKGMKFKLIFYDEVRQFGTADLKKVFGNTFRFFPKKFDSDSGMDIFGDYIVSYTGISYKHFEEDATIFVIKDSGLAESYRVWFNFMWEHCEK